MFYFVFFLKALLNMDDNKIEKKISKKNLNLRVPESCWRDIREIMKITGLSMNAICIDILRPGVKRKLSEVKNELL